MNVTMLGTASAPGSSQSDNTYLLLQHFEDAFLIDVGGNPLGKLKKLNVPLDQIKGVIITHMHVDHMYGLPSLLWGMWIGGRKEQLTIYCDETSKAQLEAIINSYGVFQWPIQFDLVIQTFDWTQETALIQHKDYTIGVFPALHGVPNVGVEVQYQGKTLIYSSDTTPNEWIKNKAHIDVLIHEANYARGEYFNHTSLEQLITAYDWSRIHKVIAIHLGEHEAYDEVIAAYKEKIDGKFELAYEMKGVTLA